MVDFAKNTTKIWKSNYVEDINEISKNFEGVKKEEEKNKIKRIIKSKFSKGLDKCDKLYKRCPKWIEEN